MKFFSAPVFALLAAWASTVGAVRVPNADTPLFYFVSTSGSTSPNLLPLRINGGTGGFATLSGAGPIGSLYFFQGQLVARDPAGSSSVYKPYINFTPASECTTFGPLGFTQGGTSNKCAQFNGFQIQSDPENSQLGARLVFNYVGGFYACGDSKDIWYKTSSNQGPSGCTPVDLYTVPVVA